MRKSLFTIFLSITSLLAFADSGQWNLYLSYSGQPQDIESADKFIYVQANNGLYSYNRHDHSIYTFSRANLLSDIKVRFIAWAKAVKKLIVVYDNGNIDFLCKDGTECENLPDYYTKATTDDKTINSIYVKENLLLIATNFGVVKVDTKKMEIAETYHLPSKIAKAAFDADFVYALSSDGATLYKGNRQKNLVDPNSWTKETFTGQVDFSTENDKINPDDEAIVKTLVFTDAPMNNLITSLAFRNGTLYVAAGGWREGVDDRNNYPSAGLCEYERNSGWKYYDKFVSAVEISVERPVTQFILHPTDKNIVYVGTEGNGIYEFNNGKQVRNLTAANTDFLSSAVADANINSYVRVLTGAFVDADEVLLINSYNVKPLIRFNTRTGEYKNMEFSSLMRDAGRSHSAMENLIKDSRGFFWFVNNSHHHPSLFCYDVAGNKLNEYNNFVNQDGSIVENVNYARCIAEDLEHNIWVGTNQGPLLLDVNLINNPKDGFIQVKVPRNDGTNFADYLMAGVDITCIAIDGAGRKWLGTNGNGVYVISADNMVQEDHFTKENSMLLDNEITDIAINKQTGEVFFATANGLCSYMGDATMPNEEMTSDNVWAYPNPVSPDYTGEITICGLSLNARVMITTSSGHLVADGISNGGSFKWNGCDKQGRRVASGIYMVHTATSDGESGVVCKVAVVN